MGLLGMVIGSVQVVAGTIKGDEKMVKNGAKRYVIGTTTMLVGDVLGVSDAAAEAFIDNDA